MPRAAIVSPDPSNPAGGVERVCVLLGSALERQGWMSASSAQSAA